MSCPEVWARMYRHIYTVQSMYGFFTSYYYFDFALSRFVGGMAAEHGVVNLLLVGHSFVRRLGNYALSAG